MNFISLKRWLASNVISILPLSRFHKTKCQVLRFANVDIGKNVKIVSSAKFVGLGAITIADDSFIGHEVLIISTDEPIEIGKNIAIGPRTLIVNGGHEIDAINLKTAGKGTSKAITIADGVWIGASVTILGGVTIGEKSVIAAGSVVISDVPSRCIYAGVPAKFVKSIDSIGE